MLISAPVTFTAINPTFNLTLPRQHVAQEDVHPVLTSRFVGKRVSCRPPTSEFEYKFEVIYRHPCPHSSPLSPSVLSPLLPLLPLIPCSLPHALVPLSFPLSLPLLSHHCLLPLSTSLQHACQGTSYIVPRLQVEFSKDSSFSDVLVVHSEPGVNIKRLNFEDVTFRCELFDRAGTVRSASISNSVLLLRERREGEGGTAAN